MIPQRFALTSELDNNALSPSELAQFAAAADLQLTRDVPTGWPDAKATMQAFPDPHAVPLGYDPFVIVPVADMPQGARGFHYTSHKSPAARIGYDPDRSLSEVATTITHEAIEAVVDGSGNRKVICTLDIPGVARRRVYVLVEPCDPPEAFTYLIDGLPVSDFALEPFYGPHRWLHTPTRRSPGITFCGSIGSPLTVAPGGYLSFMYSNHVWAQITDFDGNGPQVRTLGEHDEHDHRSHREWIDSQTWHLARERWTAP